MTDIITRVQNRYKRESMEFVLHRDEVEGPFDLSMHQIIVDGCMMQISETGNRSIKRFSSHEKRELAKDRTEPRAPAKGKDEPARSERCVIQ